MTGTGCRRDDRGGTSIAILPDNNMTFILLPTIRVRLI
jgi:hypothetical protein